MTRRCSHCSNNGHNTRTCPSRGGGGVGGGGSGIGGGVKLFGVRLTDGSIMKKSASMGNLSSLQHHSSTLSPAPGSPSSDQAHGYLSDDPAHASSSTNPRAERKKGVPWTEEEHRLFLLGLQKLGKGDWRGISRNFVTSRTPTQVASHAQKYFIRQSNATRRKRRSSLFDMGPDMAADPPPLPEEQHMLPPPVDGSDKEQTVLLSSQTVEGESPNAQPSLDLSLKPTSESMDITPSEAGEEAKEIVTSSPEVPSVFPPLIPAFIPLPFPLWPPNRLLASEDNRAEASQHQIFKPIPIVPKEPVNVDALVDMSQLSLRESVTRYIEPSPISLRLTGESSRQSAFHASAPVNGSEIAKGENSPIQAG